RSMTRKAERRLHAAQRKVGNEMDDIDELERDMAEDVDEIVAEWANKAAEIETIEIGLEKTDVSVDSLSLVWIPID
ncbi:MAG: hypothetical protein V3U50_06305, partial [Acidimicrobiia bacterium]